MGEPTGGHPRPRVLASACLLGQPVRYDGGHRQNAYLKALAAYMELEPICPELAVGLGVPRPPIHLAERGGEIRLLQVHDHSRDLTEAMHAFAQAKAAALDSVDGLVVKQNSPSCGMAKVKVHDQAGEVIHSSGSGAFTGVVLAARPELPVEEEGRLEDPELRESFLKRVYVHCRWRRHWAEGLTLVGLKAFHARHKYLMMAHSVSAYRRMSGLLAQAPASPLPSLAKMYLAKLMAVLRRRPGRLDHVKALRYLGEDLRKVLSPAQRRELSQAVEEYRLGSVPLDVPVGLLRQHLSRLPRFAHNDVIGELGAVRCYLEPYPPALSTLGGGSEPAPLGQDLGK